ncbi:MAG: NAD kinase [Bacillaceae bacterium]|nr:NAD kinase [Bacillaceae bacterium]
MKFAVASRGDETSNALSRKLVKCLEDLDLVYNEEEPDVVVTVGGDGTLLKAFHDYTHRLKETGFIGVHTGHLGFYADWKPDEVEKLVIHIAKSQHSIVEYPLVEVIVSHHGDKQSDRYLALNECSVRSVVGPFVMDVEIKNHLFETFRGDGLCISTPSGSTAYNKALGGAIVHPSIPCIQLAEMASINNRVFRTIGSPLVLPQHHTCLLTPGKDEDFHISVDHLNFIENSIKSIQCRVAEEKIRFIRFRKFPFWRRVKESFIND